MTSRSEKAAAARISLSQPGQLLFAGFEGSLLPGDLAALIEAGRVGGVILFARNVANPEQLRHLVADLHARAPRDSPLTVCIDQEGGRVQRLRAPWTEWPPMRDVAAYAYLDATRAVARALGRELADLSIDLDFAPVVDVDSNPDNPIIGDRSFSRDPEQVARHARAFVEALQATGVAACGKHFPGHGDTAVDSHLALPRLDCDWERLRAVELPPFRAVVECGVASIMTAHVLLERVDPHHPATLSATALACLREELGYDGLVFSDDLEMAAVAEHYTPAELTRRALEAGADSLLVCSRADLRDEVLANLESLPDALLEPGLRRMTELKRRFAGGRAQTGPRGVPPYVEHIALARQLAAR